MAATHGAKEHLRGPDGHGEVYARSRANANIFDADGKTGPAPQAAREFALNLFTMPPGDVSRHSIMPTRGDR